MGHSLGTNNILYSLVEAKGAEKYIEQAVLLEPCIISNVAMFLGTDLITYK